MLAAFFVSWAVGHLGAADVGHPKGTIRVCSYNLKNWLTMDRGFGDRVKMSGKPEKEKEKVVSILSSIKPDVLGVCEIGSEDDLAELQGRLAKAGLSLPHKTYTHGGDPDRRLGLLSRFPIIAQNSQTSLSYMIGELSMPLSRGILDATVQVTDTFQLHMIGVHLKSKREVLEADQEVMRRNEAHLLREHLDKILKASPHDNVLLYGDFNENSKEAPIEEIRGNRATPALLMHDVLLRDANGEVWTHFWDLQDVYSRFDYFFTSAALRPRMTYTKAFIYTDKDFNNASDHRPIVGTVEVK